MAIKNGANKAKLNHFARRNPMHNHPLLKKGGAHRKTNKSKRRLDKMAIKKEWLPLNIFSRVYLGESFLVSQHQLSNNHFLPLE